MKFPSGWRLLILVVIAAIGISGVIEAWPRSSESVSDLLIDGAAIFIVILISLIAARLLGRRGPRAR